MGEPISIGVVGCGHWGPNLIRNFKSLRTCRLKTVCDTSEARLAHLKGLYPDVEGVTDYCRMLQDGGVDAIVVATPMRFHFAIAKASLLAGKHTFIEKPMAASAAECEELIEIARQKGLVLMVGHTFLYSSPVRKIVELVRNGDLGEIRYITSRRLNFEPFQKDINVAWDLAPHDLSIILHILDEFPVSVNCQGNAHVTQGIEDVTNLSLIFKNKRFATIQSSWLEPRKVREMTLVGTRRMILYDDVQTQENIRVYDTRAERPPHYDAFADFHYSYHYGESYSPKLQQEEPLKAECQHFIDSIANGTAPLTDGNAGLRLVRILEAASQSLQCNGAPVMLQKPACPEKPGNA